jgi:hypothetical protein
MSLHSSELLNFNTQDDKALFEFISSGQLRGADSAYGASPFSGGV